MATQQLFYLSLTVNAIFLILFIIGEIYIRKQHKREKITNNELLDYSKYCKVLEKKIYKQDLDIENKKGVIKFLSEQNIHLNNEIGNIDWVYAEYSDALKSLALKRADNKFLEKLQTSKEVTND